MSLTVYADIEQGTPEWLDLRCGMLTASTIGKLLTPTLRVASNDASRRAILSLVSERITGHVDPAYVTSDMQRGVDEEPLARDAYARHFGVDVEEVGFLVRDFGGISIGYSPDGLVGDGGLIEIKSRRQAVQLGHVLDGRPPAENMAQLQTGLLVSGREWIDYVSYSGGMHLWTCRVTADGTWQRAILDVAAAFEETAADMIRRYSSAVEGMPLTERTPDIADLTF